MCWVLDKIKKEREEENLSRTLELFLNHDVDTVLKRDNRTSIIITPEFASLSLIISSRDSIKKTDATYELAHDYLFHGMSERKFKNRRDAI